MADRNPLALDQICDIGRVLVAIRLSHHQGSAGDQRPEELPHRDVETEWRFLQHAIGRAYGIDLLHPQQAVDDASMFDHYALGTAGRTRGEDNVGRICRTALRCDAARLTPSGTACSLDGDDRRSGLRQPLPGRAVQRRSGQNDGTLCVLQHQRQSLLGIIRVQRQIGCARLEHCQQSRRQMQGAARADAYN